MSAVPALERLLTALATWWLGGRRCARERGVQAGDAVGLQAVLAPVVERSAKSCSLLGVELDRTTRAYCLEAFADRLRPLGKGELLEQYVALVPGDHDDLARDVDSHPIEPARFHVGRAYSGAAA